MERVPGPADSVSATGSSRPPTGAHTLGPQVVGQRVVVRRIVPGETGPTGGPAFTDVLGVCESWSDGLAVIRREDGAVFTIPTSDIVSGKPVPPRASRASRMSAHDLERRAASTLHPADEAAIGEWRLRHDPVGLKRVNSVLTGGDPGRPLGDALRAVRAWYDERAAVPRLQVVVGSSIDDGATERGWAPQPVDGPPVHAQAAAVAQAARRLRGTDTAVVRRAERLERDWFLDAPTDDAFQHNRHLLQTDSVVFSSIAIGDTTVAQGRAAYDDGWVTISNMTVRPDHRGQGLARAVLADLVDWAGEQGAAMLLLQVLVDNEPALALYAGAGFEVHHTYRYLVWPPGQGAEEGDADAPHTTASTGA